MDDDPDDPDDDDVKDGVDSVDSVAYAGGGENFSFPRLPDVRYVVIPLGTTPGTAVKINSSSETVVDIADSDDFVAEKVTTKIFLDDELLYTYEFVEKDQETGNISPGSDINFEYASNASDDQTTLLISGSVCASSPGEEPRIWAKPGNQGAYREPNVYYGGKPEDKVPLFFGGSGPINARGEMLLWNGIWRSGKFMTLEDLVPGDLGGYIQPEDINDSGVICGRHFDPDLRAFMPVLLLPVEIRDINGAGDADDVTITPWDTSQNIANNNIAWIDAHQSAQNVAPRMPQLEFRVPGLPDGLTIEAKLNVQYTRGNRARAARNQAEDRVRIPANGNFAQVNGDAWQLYNEADWQTELTERGFFGGEATLTYQIKQVGNIVVGPEEIDFRIGGENPDDARCKAYIEAQPNAGPGGTLWFAYAIAKSESRDYNGGGSRYNQFLELPTHRRDVGRPLFGNDAHGPGGYGMFQVTGTAADNDANIPREQFWNWMENVDGAMPILAAKRAIADRWMNNAAPRNPPNPRPDGQRPQARFDRGVDVPVPDRTVRGVLFSDNAANRDGVIEDAVTIKAYNGAAAHYCSWGGNAAGWGFNNTNNLGFDYVDRVCQEVENDD